MDTFVLLVRIALRNLVASRLKTVIIGGIIFFGAILVVVGGSLVGALDDGMRRSIIGSVAGHAQVYSSKSKDELALFGSMTGDEPDLTPLDDFSRIKTVVEAVPNVARVVPMGVNGAIVTSGNSIDVALEKLRDSVRARTGAASPASAPSEYESRKAYVRQIVSVLEGDFRNYRELADAKAIAAEDTDAVARAASSAFWDEFDRDPLGSLEFLENRIAPLATDADLLFIRYIGTDMEAFRQSFDRFELVDGTLVPPGKRGFLIAKFFYEDQLKLKTARRLDKIRDARATGRRIAGDAELSRMVKESLAQVREIVLQLDPLKLRRAVAALQKELASTETEIAKLLAAFLTVDDANFDRRYAAFYRDLAPELELYRVRVGDTLTIKTFSKSGYIQSVNVRVYGTFQMKGLEKAMLAGFMNLMDLVSFRELYGHLSSEQRLEIDRIKAAAGIREVSRISAEEDLFGGGRSIVAESTAGVIQEPARLGEGAQRLRREELVDRVYSKTEIESGMVLSAAVMLKDPDQLSTTMKQIEAAGKSAGLPLRVASWQKASGMIGQFVLVLRLVLYVAVLIIFTVALVIINNSMVMATLERVQEVGTLRAIGAQKRFVLAMLVVEAAVMGVLFGGLGALVGAGAVKAIAAGGIPATNDYMFFFFSGPALRPELSLPNFAAALVIVLVVSSLSSLYPAWLAMRVPPVRAMQTGGE